MKNILMIVHTFPPMGSVGGSIRILKFLKYITELRKDIFCTIVTLRDDFILLNDPQLAHISLEEVPQKNVKIIRTNTLQPRHPKSNKIDNEPTTSRETQTNNKNRIKQIIKIVYNFIEKNILILHP